MRHIVDAITLALFILVMITVAWPGSVRTAAQVLGEGAGLASLMRRAIVATLGEPWP